MKKQSDLKPLRDPHTGTPVTREEIMDVLAHEGYSADQRKGWLKEVLTELIGEEERNPDPNQKRMIKEVKEILDDQQSGDPMSDDTL